MQTNTREHQNHSEKVGKCDIHHGVVVVGTPRGGNSREGHPKTLEGVLGSSERVLGGFRRVPGKFWESLEESLEGVPAKFWESAGRGRAGGEGRGGVFWTFFCPFRPFRADFKSKWFTFDFSVNSRGF